MTLKGPKRRMYGSRSLSMADLKRALNMPWLKLAKSILEMKTVCSKYLAIELFCPRFDTSCLAQFIVTSQAHLKKGRMLLCPLRPARSQHAIPHKNNQRLPGDIYLFI